MNKFISRAFILFLVFATQMQSLSSVVYAQEASGSADQPASSSAQSNNPFPSVSQTNTIPNPFDESQTIATKEDMKISISNLLNQALSNISSISSAIIRQATVVHDLARRTYRFNESVQLSVNNAGASDLQVALTDAKGQNVDAAVIDKSTIDTQTTITVHPFSSTRFKPGKYTIHVTDPQGNTSTQDFTWGVLAINTAKSIYTPNETAKIAMAVLDDQGAMVCDAKVSLEIKNDALKIDDLLTTDNGKITVNSQCQSHSFSLTPDYEATYQLAGIGQYDLTLTATTKNGTYSINDSINVVNSVPFDVERVSATRIYPPSIYPVIFHIKANQDFSGTVSEFVPADFQISEYASDSAKSYNSTGLTAMSPEMQEAFGTTTLNILQPFAGDYEMTQGFGAQLTDPVEKKYYEQFGLPGHDGLDFSMRSGTPVLATDDGVVTLAGDASYGTTIIIKHGWGNSYYGHLSKLEVAVGDKVKRGQEIALSGNTGHTTGAHLHFGIRPKDPNMDNGYYGKVDPAPFLVSSDSNKATFAVSSTPSSNAVKVINWNVDLKKGDTIDLAYSFLAPRVSPQFYTLGPLTFSENGHSIFREARRWQIAADEAPLPFQLQHQQTRYQFYYTPSQQITTKNATANPDAAQLIATSSASSDTKSAFKIGKSHTTYNQIFPEQLNSILGDVATPPGTPCTNTKNACVGWIFDTPINSIMPAGNWTFTITTLSSDAASAAGSSFINVCVWKVSVSGGNVSPAGTGTNIGSPNECVQGSTNVQTASGLTTQTISYPTTQVYFSSSEYIYVEIWLNTTVACGNGCAVGAQVAMQTNNGSNDSFLIFGPTLDQLMRHGQWFNTQASPNKIMPFAF